MLFIADMTLAAYIAKHGLSRKSVADVLGVSPEAVRLWLSGDRMPSPDKLRRISEWTKGEVTPNDFIFNDGKAGRAA